MPIVMVRNDITKMETDAIVNAANNTLLGGGGVDGCIHKAAGPLLLEECKTLGGCETGDAKVTGGYNLPCKYIIHTVGPVWFGGIYGEEELLASCYKKSLMLALEKGCESVAFPLISTGVYRFPKAKALSIAINTISNFLLEHDMTVYVVFFDKDSFFYGEKLFADIEEYIDDNYADASLTPAENRRAKAVRSSILRPLMKCFEAPAPTGEASFEDLSSRLNCIDESFTQMLLRKIDEKGMTDAECYKKANIDRKLFSKIRNDPQYKPSKPTAIAFAIALEMDLTEATEMLKKAGFALSHSNKFDLIIEYFIKKGNYNIFEINEALFAFDQSLLGA